MALLRVKASFAVGWRVVPRGALVDAADPIVKGRESLFEPVVATYSTVPASAPVEPVVEQATAAPGEKRTTPTRARKKV